MSNWVSCRTIVDMDHDMDRYVEVVSHRPEWAAMFDEEAAKLRAVFGARALVIHHIGSTSVPGLRAKPVLDFLLEVDDIEQVDHFNEPMKQIGYEVMGEYGMPRRRYFRKSTDGKRSHHTHTWQREDIEIDRHLAFRDFLIAHPKRAAAYGDLKDTLVARFGGNKNQYMAGKDRFCKETEQMALAWYKEISAYKLNSERLRLIPLSAAQLHFCLIRPEQLEAELGFPISRRVAKPAVVQHAIRVKKQRLINSPAKEFPWHTYWLLVIASEPFGAGLIGYKGVPDKNGEVEIGYGIDADWRNQGYMTEATSRLIAWALEQNECLAVTAWSDKGNRASARVLQKVGMKVGRETEEQYCWVYGGQ